MDHDQLLLRLEIDGHLVVGNISTENNPCTKMMNLTREELLTRFGHDLPEQVSCDCSAATEGGAELTGDIDVGGHVLEKDARVERTVADIETNTEITQRCPIITCPPPQMEMVRYIELNSGEISFTFPIDSGIQ